MNKFQKNEFIMSRPSIWLQVSKSNETYVGCPLFSSKPEIEMNKESHLVCHYCKCTYKIISLSMHFNKCLTQLEKQVPYAEIGATLFNNSSFGLLLRGFVCLLFQIWLYLKYYEQMIIDFHQLSHYYNILQLVTQILQTAWKL